MRCVRSQSFLDALKRGQDVEQSDHDVKRTDRSSSNQDLGGDLRVLYGVACRGLRVCRVSSVAARKWGIFALVQTENLCYFTRSFAQGRYCGRLYANSTVKMPLDDLPTDKGGSKPLSACSLFSPSTLVCHHAADVFEFRRRYALVIAASLSWTDVHEGIVEAHTNE
jgi:hypothetical protein